MFQQLGNLIGSTPAVGTNQPAGGLASLLSSGLKCSQNEERLMAEKSQRNLLRKYLTQATGDPIQSALISNTIPGKGYGDTLDVGLGTKNSIMQSLGITPQQSQGTNLLSSLISLKQPANTNPGLLGSVGNLAGLGGNNNSTL